MRYGILTVLFRRITQGRSLHEMPRMIARGIGFTGKYMSDDDIQKDDDINTRKVLFSREGR